MSGSPITFKGQHILNAIILISIIVLIYLLCFTQSSNLFWILLFVSFIIGFLLIIPIEGRYACSNFNAKFIFWLTAAGLGLL